MFFVALLAVAVSIPLLVGAGWGSGVGWKRVTLGLVGCAACYMAVAWALWPAGLRGGAVTMLRHYVDMAETAFPVMLNERRYEHAPKWAYAYWYFQLYRPFMLCYGLGALTALVLAVRRRLPYGAWVMLVYTGALLAAAHRAHIIGPEYLAHVLPFLTLLTGLFFAAVYRLSPLAAVAAVVGCCVAATFHVTDQSLNGMDAPARQPRWSVAATGSNTRSPAASHAVRTRRTRAG